jgi:hypothetical protein
VIVKESIEISGKQFVKTFSNTGFYIERDGEKYSEAIDPANLGRTYTETDKPIESETGELTVDDALETLNEFGVDTDDN